MRADRLLSIIMLLQARGRITAEELADEIEVSVRTIYRDIDALSAAGVPVYAERGPGGGCTLVEGYRTSLTGLTGNEIKALFMLSVPASLDELGVSQELRNAMRKLAAALPDSQRQDEERIRQRIYLDWTDWSPERESTPHLKTIHQATWENRRLHLTYLQTMGPGVVEQFERVVEPYGLVAKAGVWYLVCAGGERIRVFRVSDILNATILGENFERPVDFDLSAFWEEYCAGRKEKYPYYPVTVRVSPALVSVLKLHSGKIVQDAIIRAGQTDASGWTTLTLPFESLEDARRTVLSYGRDIEVLEPEPLRQSVIDFARQIVNYYSPEAE